MILYSMCVLIYFMKISRPSFTDKSQFFYFIFDVIWRVVYDCVFIVLLKFVLLLQFFVILVITIW